MNNTKNVYVWTIRELFNVSEKEALRLQEVIENEYLLDWSEATNRDIKTAVAYAQSWIANGGCWK